MTLPFSQIILCNINGSFDSGIDGATGYIEFRQVPNWARRCVGLSLSGDVQKLRLVRVGQIAEVLCSNFGAGKFIVYPFEFPVGIDDRFRWSSPGSAIVQGATMQVTLFLSDKES